MKLEKNYSERLQVLRFPLIVGIVFLHAYWTDVEFSYGIIGMVRSGPFSGFVRDFVSLGLARMAVPLFFSMSGYLFFYGFNWSLEKYKIKIKSRVKTLLIPFILWNLFTLVFLAVAQSFPATQIFFSGKNVPISSFTLYDYFNAMIGIDKPPISYQFWFIRDLMVVVLLVPVLHIVYKMIPTVFIVIITILWFFQFWPIYIPSIEAFFFFNFGTYLAVTETNIFKVDKSGKWVLLIYIFILVVETLTRGSAFYEYLHRAGIILGITAALYATKFVHRNHKLKKIMLWFSGCSFFVFAMHEPLLIISKKIAYKILEPNTDIMVLTLYFAIPLFVISVSILVYLLLRSLMPKFLGILTGGRLSVL